MKVLKICINEWKNASRDKRELSACRELGYDTLVMAKGEIDDKFREDEIDGFKVLRFTTRPFGGKIPSSINRFFSLFFWAKWVRTIDADILTGHDIIAVLIAWMSRWFQKKKAVLVYDSHEFEPGRNAVRSRFQTWFIMHLEKFLMKRCAFTIMPCDSAADELVKLYHLVKRPLVVRSTPDYWEYDERAVKETRNSFNDYFGEEISTIIMYHGGIMENRGLAQIMDAISDQYNVGIVILGEILVQSYYDMVMAAVHKYNMEKRVLYHPAVPHNELFKFVAAADIGMVTIIPKTKSYYFALPNKFFENIQSLTPMIVSDLPEMAKIVKQYDIGLLVNGNDPDSIKKGIQSMSSDCKLYDHYKANLKIAKKNLCWENEKQILINAYRNIELQKK